MEYYAKHENILNFNNMVIYKKYQCYNPIAQWKYAVAVLAFYTTYT